LIWISFVTKNFAWWSWQTASLVGFAAVASVVFVIAEAHVPNPIIPLPILRMRVTALAIVASIGVGVAMFGASVFLAQYFQLGRGMSPTMSGLMTAPMMGGVLISSLFVGRLVSRLGVWKPFVVAGAILMTVGSGLLSTIDVNTSLVLMSVYMAVSGLGVGMLMQNLVLAVQNSVSIRDVGAATGTVTFFRSLGGAIGIQALGFVFERRMTSLVQSGLPDVLRQSVAADAAVNPTAAQTCGALATNPAGLPQAAAQCPQTAAVLGDLAQLQASHGGTMNVSIFHSDAFRALLFSSIADSIGRLFLIAACLAATAIVTVIFMKPTRLRSHFDDDLG